VTLIGIKIGSQVKFENTDITNEAGYAVVLDASAVANGVLFEETFVSRGKVSLSGATVDMQLLLAGEYEELNLQNTVVKGSLIIEKDKVAKINLYGLKYESILFVGNNKSAREPSVEEMVGLIGKSYQYTSWPFIEFARTLELKGNEMNARETLIEMERERTKHQKYSLWMKIMRKLSDCLISYGYKPSKILAISLVYVFIVAFLINSVSGAFTPVSNNDYTPVLNPLMFSLDTFLPLVDLHQAKYWMPDSGYKAFLSLEGKFLLIPVGNLLLILQWLTILMGWAFSIIFAAAATGLVKTKGS
jgi:hypothetical protein